MTAMHLTPTDMVTLEVKTERKRQNEKWGEQNHPDGTGCLRRKFYAPIFRRLCETAFEKKRGTWAHILLEELAEALDESDPGNLRAELIQIAAVAVAWVEAIDRRRL